MQMLEIIILLAIAALAGTILGFRLRKKIRALRNARRGVPACSDDCACSVRKQKPKPKNKA